MSANVLRTLMYVLWVAPPIALAFLAITMVRRQLYRRYPMFHAYVISQVALFLVEFISYHFWRTTNGYFYVYWTGAALSVLLSFMVLYELVAAVFEPFEALRDLGRALFGWAAVVLVFVAVLLTVTDHQASLLPSFGFVVALERSVRVMQCGIVLLMMVSAPYLGLKFRHRFFGIAVGFGVIAAVDLAAVAAVVRVGFSAGSQMYFNLARMSAFTFSSGLWIYYFLHPEPARIPALQTARGERWNFALSTALHPDSTVPSLPMIIGAVDRALGKLNGNGDDKGGPKHADQ